MTMKLYVKEHQQEEIYRLACGWLDSTNGNDLGALDSWKELYHVLCDTKGVTEGELERAAVQYFDMPAEAERGIFVSTGNDVAIMLNDEHDGMAILRAIDVLDLDGEEAADIQQAVDAFSAWVEKGKIL